MKKSFLSVAKCSSSNILARDVFTDDGVKLVAKDTFINDYIVERLLEMGIQRVWVYETPYESKADFDKVKIAEVKKEYIKNVLLIKDLLKSLSTGNGLSYKVLTELTYSVYQSENFYIIGCLDELKNLDEYTYSHSINTGFYSMLIARWIKLPEHNVKEIIQAGLIHDIGKTRVPAKILNKPGFLTADEYAEIKRHPAYGYEILNESYNAVGSRVKNAVLTHHERLNGSGYPEGISGNELDLYARILGIADVYDAITSDRVYKKKMTPFGAFEEFMSMGNGLFDISILKTFLNSMSAYYTGVKVLLSNGQTGEVAYIPPHNIVSPVINTGSGLISLSSTSDIKILKII